MIQNNILAIDHGNKNIGLAISVKGDLPLGFKTLQNSKSAMQEISNITKENNINLIIIGYPNFKFGDSQIKKVDDFIVKLKESLGKNIKIKRFDETLTSKQANRYIGKNKKIQHQEAARIILEDWLNSKNLFS
ncbi:MAG: Holliday junction resolvase RuvX [Candidatus Moranbacteria bacterium]|nr:Holliday junction resolvase RuvX [Candidatus Moranbacteria bacterium]